MEMTEANMDLEQLGFFLSDFLHGIWRDRR